ncbi:hypothetical protein PQ455_00865 [Sphingomonas naphthae]|uniref:Uncharacterized protein n=1 Tax=Sphingomonas naphthae TaxID=1813468 RepID=A0ABY7TNL4_9SPHN|nr:hypothetical protein [Sphingomonas naphthae]WCT73814.1 hypothetical protein PQ455_00865 [Sphingomonas naphthae]
MLNFSRAFAAPLLVAAALNLSGCATTTASIPVAPVAATIANQTGKTIARVEYQACGAPAESWSPLALGAVGSGRALKFELPEACVNMTAYFEDGRVAGTQVGVRRDFPFTWTLS